MKGKLQFPVSLSWLLPILLCVLVSCSDDDDYYYPSVKLDFLTVQAGADGSLQSILTDEGETLAVVEDASNTRIDANSSLRIVSNYGKAATANGESGAKLYAVLKAISPVPQPKSNMFLHLLANISRQISNIGSTDNDFPFKSTILQLE